MRFACDRCGRLYSVADDKVRGRPFRVRCKACDHIIVVRSPPPARARATDPAQGAFGERRLPKAPRASPPATRPSMSDEEMAWLADGVHGAKTVPSLPAEHLPPLPIDDTPTTAGSMTARSSPHRVRIAATTALSFLAVAGAVAWFTVGRTRRAAPPSPPVAVEVAPPAASPVQPEPAANASPARETVAPDESPPPVLAAPQPLPPAAAAASPAPAGTRTSPPPAGADRRRDLHIARNDLRLLDLLGKKEDVVPPAPSEKVILDTGRPALDREAVQRTVSDHLESFAACVSRAAQADPKKRLRAVTVTLTVQPSGVVSSASLGEAGLDRTLLGRCIVSTSLRIVFPAFQGEPHEVSIPLSLSAVQ